MPKRLQTYDTPAITVTFDPNLCTHAAACVRGLPLVFDVRRQRWIQPEHAAPADVAAQVARCPSSALQFRYPEAQQPSVSVAESLAVSSGTGGPPPGGANAEATQSAPHRNSTQS